MLITPTARLTTICHYVKTVLLVMATSVFLAAAMPVFAETSAKTVAFSKPVGEKEQRITDRGERAVEAEKAAKAAPTFTEFPSAIELYSDDELNQLIAENTHLKRVRADECQLVDDIKARAELVRLPTYQFLWGDMLAWGVCVDKNAELGIHYMRAAARQGQPRALEQLGRYYVQGKFVQQDIERAVPLFEQSAKLGFLPAKIQWAELLIQGYGSPYDYQMAYSYLYNTVTADVKMHKKLTLLLAQLENLMPERVVTAAKHAAKYQ
ncbi:sel1 repeat family protein [Moritella sp. 36]|uniref:tetratricopeptide repeat protein n=1 Tax=Moritella sp. 36 TaxID=2746233 RepID=UPI001BADDBBD|nr:SEL1-like repeat protein [Moritella sp. 36]QUM87665.1 sel1 repeat family protein [Moritella sp. 36]